MAQSPLLLCALLALMVASARGDTYRLITDVRVRFIQDSFVGCQRLGGRLAGWSNTEDRTAIKGFLSDRYPKLFTGEDTENGRYILVRVPITAFQQAEAYCRDRKLRFVAYKSRTAPRGDRAAVEAALRIVRKVYVNDDTVGGQCPVVRRRRSGYTEVLENCFQSLPFLCGPR